MENGKKLKFETKIVSELIICPDLKLWSFVQV